jgi:thiol-disulfide isomerase/thioredoxin
MKRSSSLNAVRCAAIVFTALAVLANNRLMAAGPADESQTPKPPALKVGDAAPPLLIERWLKGDQVEKFEPGKVYVVEFWASWCLPCLAAMPHLADIQEKYKDQGVTVIALDSREANPELAAPCVKRFDKLMAFRVAMEKRADDKGRMAETWLDAAGVPGMPSTWIIDRAGKIAWIGHPANVERPLAGIVRGDYNPAKERELAAKLNARRQQVAAAVDSGDYDKAWKIHDEMDKLDPFSQLERSLDKFKILLEKKKDYAAAWALIRQLADGPLKNDWYMQSKIAQQIVALPEKDKRDLDLALQLMRRVVELKSSEDWMTMKSFAEVYAAQGNWDKAIALQAKVVQSLGGTAHDREKEILKRYQEGKAGGDKPGS